MMGGLKPYPAMKDSGVEWLGKVPEHWEVRRLKSCVDINRRTLREDTDPSYTFDYLDIGSVGTARLVAKPEKMSFGSAPSRARRIVAPGDTLVSTVRTYLKAIWHVEDTDSALVASTGFAVLSPTGRHHPKLVSYFCQSAPFVDRITANSIGVAYPAIAESRLSKFEIGIPPLEEQSGIVHFLDHADQRIQRYIRAKEKLIALLEEQKQAVVHQAVTGQIDVRTGRPYPAYKDSGVEWLGQVPEHWELCRIGAVLRERGSLNTDGIVTEVLSVLRDRGVIPYSEKGNIGNKKSDDITRYKIVKPNDIVVNCMNVIIGSVGISQFEGCLSPVYYVLTQKSKLDDIKYLHTCFQNKIFQKSLIRLGNGILAHRMRIPMQLLKCEIFPRPPKTEQASIVRFLDQVDQRIQRHIRSTKEQMAFLSEFRGRLVADIVTGKFDVRDFAFAQQECAGLASVNDQMERDEQVEIEDEPEAVSIRVTV